MTLLEQLTIIAPALLAGAIVLATHIPLGRQVLRRGIIFIDLAIAQIAAIGAILVSLFVHEDGYLTWLIPLVFAIAGASLIAILEKHVKTSLEALIGVIYISSVAISSLVVASSPHGHELLSTALAGQILWTDWSMLTTPLILTIALVGIFVLFPRCLDSKLFYPIFAIAITMSVQIIGVYLVFATLIVPALASIATHPNKQIVTGFVIGITGYVLGLLASLSADLPSGPVIVLALVVTAVTARIAIGVARKNP
jgi:zinc/manganese transport system permease protein